MLSYTYHYRNLVRGYTTEIVYSIRSSVQHITRGTTYPTANEEQQSLEPSRPFLQVLPLPGVYVKRERGLGRYLVSHPIKHTTANIILGSPSLPPLLLLSHPRSSLWCYGGYRYPCWLPPATITTTTATTNDHRYYTRPLTLLPIFFYIFPCDYASIPSPNRYKYDHHH